MGVIKSFLTIILCYCIVSIIVLNLTYRVTKIKELIKLCYKKYNKDIIKYLSFNLYSVKDFK